MEDKRIYIRDLLKKIDYKEFKLNFESYRKLFIEKHNIKLSEYSGYVLCKYHTIIREWHKTTTQTRGIVLDSLTDWEVVNFPFTKFFNIQETSADEIDWSTATFQEKLDGSIIYLWWAERLDKWMISTSGTCNAYDANTKYGISFGQIVEDVIVNKLKYEYVEYFFNKLHRDYCYIFELESQYNQIVVDQKDNEGNLTLLGARSIVTLEEVNLYNEPRFLDIIKPIKLVKRHNLTKDNVDEFVNSRSADKAEGLVICDAKFNRVKIKSEAYLRVHRIQGSLVASWKNVLELLILNSDTIDDIRGLLGKVENDRLDQMQEKISKHLGGYVKTLESLPIECLQSKPDMGKYIKENKLDIYSTFIWQCHFGNKSQLQVFTDQVTKNSKNVSDMLMENY